MKLTKIIVFLLLSLTVGYSFASTTTVEMYATKDGTSSVGSIQLKDTTYGLLLIPNLHNLTPGAHGFHVHQNPSCADKGNAAGSHFDPLSTHQHLGPYDAQGHEGDLPVLLVSKDGTDTLPMLAPRLTVADVKNHSLMIHANGDNYSDDPKALGGGGARVACGVIAE